MAAVNVVRGTNDKPAASQALIDAVNALPGLEGQLMTGYPIISASDGRHPIDAVLVSPQHGVVVFDLIEGDNLAGYQDRQDDAATRVQQRLFGYRELVRKRELRVNIDSVSFAPRRRTAVISADDDYHLAYDAASLGRVLSDIAWQSGTPELYELTLSAIQNISTVRKSRTPRQLESAQSRGARLQRLEDSIATLDMLQSQAVIETVEGVQRIRGLAGSGKTIVLALKGAYLHAQHPEWRIAVTFNTRSLKDQFRRLITTFSIESSGEEPDWDKLRILNSWGAPGRPERDGLYYEFCRRNNVEYNDFRSARREFGRDDAFSGACDVALAAVEHPEPFYDVILVDEAQDLPAEFLRLCYSILEPPHRLVYAYDELQRLNGSGLPPAEQIFGLNENGRPRVSFDAHRGEYGARSDIVLDKCYRNSRPVLVSAHGLGFGVYRQPPRHGGSGLVQMFDQPHLWTDIGYRVVAGDLEPGKAVALERGAESSPLFLENHSPVDDLVFFGQFHSKQDQDQWVADQIAANLAADELRHSDIIVINTDPLTTRSNLGPIRKLLRDKHIATHVAGEDTDADVFFLPGAESVTFTGIFRAKGNEAAMVYIVNAEECQTSAYNLATVRNRLFTAMTRSKAWVRVLGVGPQMA
ncbi:hypothetical protein DSM43518_05629 [Mycobacterium marinum]|uniref:DEAD/DEAH box helicase n=1 Tax=Mycobacterium marinum TaxID=1781 RepID=UPI000EBF70E9|nr:ATP-binding domain-containing protein [Mycobacterium marinum]RFZ01136.1 hypothetical protein DSM43518_05629 [Mycobacterium marinum]